MARPSKLVNAFTAHREWAVRPDDERKHSIQEMRDAILARHEKCYEGDVNVRELSVVPRGEDLRLTRGGAEARLTHWSAGQLAGLAGVPADYVRRIPASLAATNLNYGLSQRAGLMKVYIHKNGTTHARSVNSEIYGRIFDKDVVNLVDAIATPMGFKPPMTNPKGVFGMPSEAKGSKPGGLYVSDRDMFMMLVNDDYKVEVDGELLGRALIVRNSEVGASKLVIAGTYNRYVCGNNIQHGFKSSFEISITHKGEANAKFQKQTLSEISRFLNSDTNEEVRKIRKAMAMNVARNDEDAVDWLRSKDFLKNVALAAVEAAKQEEGGAGSLWQLINGLTATARKMSHTDQRNQLERKAGKLLALAA